MLKWLQMMAKDIDLFLDLRDESMPQTSRHQICSCDERKQLGVANAIPLAIILIVSCTLF